MPIPVLRHRPARATAALLLSCLLSLCASPAAPAGGLAHLEVTQASLTPEFSPATPAYTAEVPSNAAAAAVHALPDAGSSRLFLQAANAPWQQVARGATIAAGGDHSLVLRGDGTVVAWGGNSHGQTSIPSAAQTGVTALAAGANHSLALGEDGKVHAWGDLNFGQCNAPAEAQSGVVAIAAGGNQSLALTSTGAVIAWGGGGTSQLPGNLTSGVVAIAAGNNHGLALTSAGAVVAWGDTPPVPALAQSDVVAITAAAARSLALRRDGRIVIWGYDSESLLTAPAAAQGAVALAASAIHNFALRADGSVIAWGPMGSSPLDPPASVASDVVAIAAGGSHAHALKRDGSLITWGSTSYNLDQPPLPARNSLRLPASAALPLSYGANRLAVRVVPTVPPATATIPLASLRGRGLSSSHGPTGVLRADGAPVAWNGAPAPVSPANFTTVSYGISHALGIKANGSLMIWGSASPTILTPPGDATDLVAVSAAPFHSLALRRDGRVVAWGDASPALLTLPASVRSGVVAISASASLDLALKSDGSVVSWGTSSYAAPASVSTDVIAISAGLQNALALKSDGSLVVWGNPTHPVATQVPADAAGLVAVSAGSTHALALRSDGRVVAWGENGYGKCTVPAAAEAGVVAISAGPDFSLAVKADGSLVSWGAPGTIPTNATTGLLVPPTSSNIQITSTPDLLAPRMSLAAGDGFTAALRDTGAPVAWGYVTSLNNPPSGLSDLVGLVARDSYTLALRPDGTVTGWGPTNTAQLAIPSAAQSGVVALAGGASHALALKRDGSVVAWGGNSSGQCNIPDLNPPTSASNGYFFTAIAAADSTSFGLRSDGRVIAWGSSTYGLTTVPTAAQSGVVALAAGYRHALALKRDGSVVGWGDSYGGANASLAPAVPVVALAAGESFSLYLFADGTVSGVGSNNFSVPAQAATNVVAIAAGRSHASVLKTDGTVYSWGNFSGAPPSPLAVLRPGPAGDDYRVTLTRAYPSPALSQLTPSTGPLTPGFGPATLNYAQNVSSASAGLSLNLETATQDSSIQLRVNGAVPQILLPGATLLISPSPSQNLFGITPAGAFTSDNTFIATAANMPAAARANLVSLAYGRGYTVGLAQKGGLVAWSPGFPTALGIPTELTSDIIQIVSDQDGRVFAVRTDGTVFAWTPGNTSLDTVPALLQSGVARLSVSGGAYLALMTEGSVRAWGYPAPPPETTSGVVAIHAGNGVAFAQKADGSLVLWGNYNPALATIPAAVRETRAVSIAADHYTAQALLADGTVVSWGAAGQPGLIVPAAARTGVVALACYGNIRAAQKADGSIVVWNININTPNIYSLNLALPRSAPVALRHGANRLSLRVTPLGRPLSGAPISTGFYRHYAVTQQGTVTYRPAFSFTSNTVTIPTEAQSGVTAVYSGGYGEYALTTAGRLVRLAGVTMPEDAQPSGPGQTPVVAPIAAAAVGGNFALLLRSDGSIFPLGNFPSTSSGEGPSGYVAVAAGTYHALALRADGRVVTWGTTSYTATVPTAAQSSVVAIAAATDRSLALRADGSVVAWGNNGLSAAVPPQAQSGVVGIALNDAQAFALKADGSVFAWGPESSAYPPPSTVSSGVIALFAYGRHQVALKADGSTVTWGRHSSGSPLYPADFGAPLASAPVRDYHLTITRSLPPPALMHLAAGVGALAPAFGADLFAYALPSTPYPALALPGLSPFPGDTLELRTGAGSFVPRASGPTLAASNGSLFALRSDGTVRAFSGDSVGTLPAAAQTGVAALSAGRDHAFALRRDGSLLGWGSNSYNQLSALPGGTDFIALASGVYHGLALRRDGSVAAWGRNFEQQLVVPAAATDCVAIAAGEYTSMALRRDGAVVAWGRFTSTPQAIPADAQSGVVAIAAGRDHYLALRADGRVVQWGNTSGFLDVPPLRFIAIATSGDQNLGLRPNGEIVTWGGFSGPVLSLTPANSLGLVAIAAGPSFAAALRADGSLVTIPASGSGFSQLNGSSDFAGPFALPVNAAVPLALGDNTVELRVARPDSGLAPATYTVNVSRAPAPEFRLVSGTNLATGNPWLHNFGLQRLGVPASAALLTLANPGTADLVISAANLAGAASADFALSGLSLPLTLAPGASTTFTATVTPAAAGIRFAGLLLGANLPNEEPTGFALRAEGVSYAGDRSYWRSTQFNGDELADAALEATLWGDLADPDADGIPNLLEYATGTDAEIPNAAPLPVSLDASAPGGPRLTFTYQRRMRAAVGGLAYRIEWSDTLAADSWSAEGVTETVTGSFGFHETVVASVPAGSSRRFLRLRVTAPAP